MLLGHTPLEAAVVWLIAAALVVGCLTVLVAIFRATFRYLKASETAQVFVLSGCAAAVMGLGAFWFIRATSLDDLERDCRDHILAQPQMAGVSHLSAEKHIDFWNYGASGGGFVDPWSVPPHTEPKVMMDTRFYRDDGRPHYSWMQCFYKPRPNSGNPPQLVFDKVDLGWEFVLDEAGHHVAWHPVVR